MLFLFIFNFFFFNYTATTEIYTLSLHDALPICLLGLQMYAGRENHYNNFVIQTSNLIKAYAPSVAKAKQDRKSTRLNSSHVRISYAVFCLKKKTNKGLNAERNPPATMPVTRPTD